MTSHHSNEPGKCHKSLFFPRLQLYLTLGLTTLALASCGGGGGGSAAATATITSISPVGMVQATTRNIAITGTNFSSGMTLSLTSNSLGTIPVTPISVLSTLITASVTISTAPTERYVTVNILSNGTTVASTILGVASVSNTLLADIQPIFTASCGGCHTGNATQNYLDLSSYAATAGANGPINQPSVGAGCSSKLRVKPGDPRSNYSVLIDKISNNSPCTGSKMTGSPTALVTQNITDIIEWVAGGAN